jgi:hypothetical protein
MISCNRLSVTLNYHKAKCKKTLKKNSDNRKQRDFKAKRNTIVFHLKSIEENIHRKEIPVNC